MSGLFGSITIKGNRLTDFAGQTATVGIPIPFGYGKFPADGNVIFAPMPPKEHVKKKKQGKGGVKSEEYSYTLSYAVSFTKGPIFGYWTIKRGGKVVWTQDPAASVEDHAYAAKWQQKATFYYGTKTQLPDSTIEAYEGAGNVSGHRDLAYIVVEDDDVTDNGGAVPPYEAIVIASAPDVYLTSRPYNIVFDDEVIASDVDPRDQFASPFDYLNSDFGTLIGKLNEVIIPYVNWPVEKLNSDFIPIVGEFRDVLRQYVDWPIESLKADNLVAQNGLFYVALLSYVDWPGEYIKADTLTPLAGTFA